MKNSVLTTNQIQKITKDLNSHILSFVNSVEKKDYSLVTNQSIHNLGWVDSFRLFLLGFEDFESPIKNLIINSVHRINLDCPLAVPLYFQELLNEKKSLEPKRGNRVKYQDLIKGLKKTNDDFILTNLEHFSKTLELAGSLGTISIENHNDLEPEVSIEEGYKTLCRLNHFFHGELSTQELQNFKIIVVDGAIVEVSEIHHILQRSYDTKEKFILIATSFSDDVSNTLFINWQNKKTDVIPFEISDSLDSLNEIKDICSILSVLPVSNNNGTTVSSIDLTKYPVNNVFYAAEKDQLRILLNDESSVKLKQIREQLQEKLKQEKVSDVKEYITKRISRMSSRNVVLRMKFEEIERGFVQDKAAAVFKYISRCANQGVIELNEKYPVKYLPWIDATRAIRMAKSDKETMKSIEAIVRLER